MKIFNLTKRLRIPPEPYSPSLNSPQPLSLRGEFIRRGNPFLFLWIATPDYIRFAMTTFCSSLPLRQLYLHAVHLKPLSTNH